MLTALDAISGESTKPLSETTPRYVSTLIALLLMPGSLTNAAFTRVVTVVSPMYSPVDWRVAVGAPAVWHSAMQLRETRLQPKKLNP